jgi:hypothetical protein
MSSNARKSKPKGNSYVSAAVLRKVALSMLPFYRKLAGSRSFAIKWAKAVRTADLTTMESLFNSAAPKLQLAGFSTNAIGYFIDFPSPSPIHAYTNATSLRPGTTQFTFSSTIQRSIAKAIVPLYRELGVNRAYCTLVVKAIQTGNSALLNRLIRSAVPTSKLKSVNIYYSGISLGFKYPSSKFVYYNEFFRDRVY